MYRRDLFRFSAACALALSKLPGRLFADQPAALARRAAGSPLRRAPELVGKAMTTPTAGFPTIEPIFAASFLPAAETSTQLISANGFTSFNSQVQTLAASGYRLASFTAIRNRNATWYYAALVPGSGNFMLVRTSDPNQFQQTFQANQSGYELVDFSVTWEQSELYYTGYWLAASSPVSQMFVWDLAYSDFNTQWTALSGQGWRLTRIQSFPQQDVAAYTGLYQSGSGAYAAYYLPLPDFSAYATGKLPNNTLIGLAYDSVDGHMCGCWRTKIAGAQFVWNQDWNTLQATAQQLAASGLVLSAVAAYPNAPDFDDYFAANLQPFVMGYAYAVSQNGQVVSEGYGLSRNSAQTNNPNTPFTPTSRINLASISKAVTGIALEVLIRRYPSVTLDSPFWPLISSMIPNPDPSVKPVTIRNLATMYSGMQTPPDEGPLTGDLWTYLNTYLAMPLVGTPGVTYSYNNENFTILQGVIEQVTGQDYVAWVTANVIVPAGINTTIFNATPDPQTTATLLYGGPTDTRTGDYFSALEFVAPGGWVSNAQELIKVMLALRNTGVIPAAAVSEMLTGGIGWFSYAGAYGTYYNKNGGLSSGATPPQTLNTCIVRLAEGYDIALVVNTQPPIDVVNLCSQAFDSRGLLTTDQPPAIAAVIGAASYLPQAAPATYCSIQGAGFTNQPATDWSSSITGPALPTTVESISVNVNGAPAYIQYVSAGQVNFLLPAGIASGTADVELITPIGVMTSTLPVSAVAPGLFTYTWNGVVYPAAVFATASGVVYVAATGALPGYTSRPAAPGDIIELYATGCGPTTPTAPDGVVLTTYYPAASLSVFQVTIAGKSAAVLFAALVSPGLWQLNVQVPSGLVGGNQPLVLSVNSVTSQPNVMLTLLGG